MSILIFIPEALQKESRRTSKANQSCKVPELRRITSSTKRRCDRVSEGESLMPRMRPLDLASLMSKLRPSMTKIKIRGDKGQPCRIPREAVKKFEGVPLTKTAKFAVVM